uniref:Type I restriction enzyme R protein N terminus (HSDR_N) n=1 Tax=Candidatus Kentrum sp. UNK TaxID=2126344 RepID=A0A451A3Y9_9GAMM|nr:MAG: hypothetical protein BECKUNK1418G_GA0071005_10137 [Candidatus Kentron sp. UNK]VFK69451.1 MAG: hypothetical protein BECKUNK1418H_GA0071006_10147 [Candidatus Kentron sp. UNK]
MPYSDFNLKRIKQKLGLKLAEKQGIFSSIESVDIDPYFKKTLEENIPLARAINTEKARSELIISNVLVEVRRMLNGRISLFSGIEFDVDKERGRNGVCDFLISASREQFMISAPIITVVEAKNENIVGGLGQCIAEMYAARLFNQEENDDDSSRIYGTVTTGTAWKFLKMEDSVTYIDLDEYMIEASEKIIGILLAMATRKA